MDNQDHGPQPFVSDIEELTKQNRNFRTTLWTGDHLQVTLMHIAEGAEIGLEVHERVDQFLRIEQGLALVEMGDSKDHLTFSEEAEEDFAIVVPAGKWHNVTNIGHVPLKLYSIYSPPEHEHGTVHGTKKDAMKEEE